MKIQKNTLVFCKNKVHYLGYNLPQEGKSIIPDKYEPFSNF